MELKDLQRSYKVSVRQLRKFRISPQDLTKDELMNQLMDRYELQMHVMHLRTDLLKQKRADQLTILKEERTILMKYSKSTLNEGKKYNHHMSTNPNLQEDCGLLPIHLVEEMREKLTCFDIYAMEFDERAEERTSKIKDLKANGR